MLLAGLAVLALSAAPHGCEEECSIDLNRCTSSCRGAERCSSHCTDRRTDCLSHCAAAEAKNDQAKIDAKHQAASPCLGDLKTHKLAPCSEAELRKRQDAANTLNAEADKRLCKDAEGKPVPCKKDQDATKDVIKESADKYCVGEDHVARECKDKGDKAKGRMSNLP